MQICIVFRTILSTVLMCHFNQTFSTGQVVGTAQSLETSRNFAFKLNALRAAVINFSTAQQFASTVERCDTNTRTA